MAGRVRRKVQRGQFDEPSSAMLSEKEMLEANLAEVPDLLNGDQGSVSAREGYGEDWRQRGEAVEEAVSVQAASTFLRLPVRSSNRCGKRGVIVLVQLTHDSEHRCRVEDSSPEPGEHILIKSVGDQAKAIRLAHPFVTCVHFMEAYGSQVFSNTNCPFYIMETMLKTEGTSANRRRRRKNPIDVLAGVEKLADALRFLHARQHSTLAI